MKLDRNTAGVQVNPAVSAIDCVEAITPLQSLAALPLSQQFSTTPTRSALATKVVVQARLVTPPPDDRPPRPQPDTLAQLAWAWGVMRHRTPRTARMVNSRHTSSPSSGPLWSYAWLFLLRLLRQ